MTLRRKMFCLTLVVFAGLLVSLLMGMETVRKVRVGGQLYSSIQENRGVLDRLALLRGDLNQMRADASGLLLESDADKALQIERGLDRLMEAVGERFAEIMAETQGEEMRIALEDAHATWQAFETTLRGDVFDRLHAGDREGCRDLVNGIQKMRYERFIDQLSYLGDGLTLEIEALEAQAAQTARRKMVTSTAANGAIFLVVATLTLLLSRAITRPVLQGAAFAEEVAGGDLTQTLQTTSGDETGKLTRALNAMVTGLGGMVGRIRESADELDAVSRNIFAASTRVMETARTQGQNIAATSAAVGGINNSIRQVGHGVENLAALADENTASMMEMAASIEEVAGNVDILAKAGDEVGSAITEMAASIRQVSANAGSLQAAAAVTAAAIAEIDTSVRQVEAGAAATVGIAEEVRRDAEIGKTAADAAMAGMHEIRNASRITAEMVTTLSAKAENIGAILTAINEVADQINLLALNAAIIAAQAGDKGRSFAVVAEEIRELADRTSGSSREIAAVIKTVQEGTRRAVQSIDEAERSVAAGERLSRQSGEALQKIFHGIEKTTVQMGDVAQAAHEQSRNSQKMRTAMERVSEMVAQIAAATRQQDQASGQIMLAAERMKGLTGEVRASTREQSRAGATIARASEEMTGMIQKIKSACDEQTRDSDQIGRAIGDIEEATAVNLEATQVMAGAVTTLREQTQALKQEMETFRTAEAG